MKSNMTIRATLQLLERRLLPKGHPQKLSQAALEEELAILDRDKAWVARRYWRAGIELSLPGERE